MRTHVYERVRTLSCVCATFTSACAPQHAHTQALHYECAHHNEQVRTITQHTSPDMCTAIDPLSGLLSTMALQWDLRALTAFSPCYSMALSQSYRIDAVTAYCKQSGLTATKQPLSVPNAALVYGGAGAF